MLRFKDNILIKRTAYPAVLLYFMKFVIKKFRNSKSVRLIIKPGGQLVVTAPTRISQKTIERFIASKEQWIKEKIEQLKLVPVKNAKDTRNKYLEHKEAARKLIKERLTYFNSFYKFSFKKISIRNQSTRWGSCSRKGNLNFNYKLVLLKPELADYIIVHELCHLKEFNHSKRFWDLVAKTIPGHKHLRKQLKQP